MSLQQNPGINSTVKLKRFVHGHTETCETVNRVCPVCVTTRILTRPSFFFTLQRKKYFSDLSQINTKIYCAMQNSKLQSIRRENKNFLQRLHQRTRSCVTSNYSAGYHCVQKAIIGKEPPLHCKESESMFQ